MKHIAEIIKPLAINAALNVDSRSKRLSRLKLLMDRKLMNEDEYKRINYEQ